MQDLIKRLEAAGKRTSGAVDDVEPEEPPIAEALDMHDMAAKFIGPGMSHRAFQTLQRQMSAIEAAMKKAQSEVANAKRVGAGGTVESDVLRGSVLPEVEKYGRMVANLVGMVQKMSKGK